MPKQNETRKTVSQKGGSKKAHHNTKNSKKSTTNKFPPRPVVHPAAFPTRPVGFSRRPDQTALGAAVASVGNDTLNTKEMLTEYTFYEDVYFGETAEEVQANPVSTYWFPLDTASVTSTTGDAPFGRVDWVKVYALPNTQIGGSPTAPSYDDVQVDASYFAIAAVPAGTPSTSGAYPAANSKTMVLPSLAPKWVKILQWKASEVFADSNLLPKIADNLQAIFSLGFYDTTTGAVYGRCVQTMVRVGFRVPLGVRNTIDIPIGRSPDFQGNISTGPTVVFPCQVDLKAITDSI